MSGKPTVRNPAPTSLSGQAATLPCSASIAPAVLLVVQAAVYVWMAPRGFEFTDEAYYLLNFLYWRDLTATVSFFGAYFEWPFKLLGQSIFAIRVFSFFALVVSSAFLTREAVRFTRAREMAGANSWLPYAVAGAAASSFYFGYFNSLRAPSYNLLALCTMLVATGLLLRLAKPGRDRVQLDVIGLLYGVALGACCLSKAPTGLLMFVFHAVFFAMKRRDLSARQLLELSSLIALGVVVNVGLLQWADPNWLPALREGVAMTNVIGHGGLWELAGSVVGEIHGLGPGLVELCALAVVVILLARNIRYNRRAQISVAVVALMACCALELGRADDVRFWLPIVAASLVVLWSLESPRGERLPETFRGSRTVALSCLLLALPLAFSFGTNQPVFEHSQMAAVFGVVALLISLQRLADHRCIGTPALSVSIALLCVPTLSIHLRNAFDVGHAYRIRTALLDQTISTPIGLAGRRLLLDADTRDEIAAMSAAGHAAGFPPGTAVLDLTGDGPGLIYVLGGRPLGEAWLTGGYAGSETAAARLIARLPVDDLRHAWLLTSSTNPRRIIGWQRLLAQRVGTEAYERMPSLRIHTPTYSWYGKTPETMDVELWRPWPSARNQECRPRFDLGVHARTFATHSASRSKPGGVCQKDCC